MLILGIETATNVCSVALLDKETVIVSCNLERPRQHAALLPVLIQDALRYADCRPEDLTALALSKGPGSYTGLRIGTSLAKGLAFAHGTDLVAVPSLEALAFSLLPMTEANDLICPVFDARRDDLYTVLFRHDPAQPTELQELVQTDMRAVSTLPDWLGPHATARIWLIGDGVAKVMNGLPPNHGLPLHPVPTHRPSAVAVAQLARARWLAGQREDLATFEPFYLQDFVARRGRPVFEKLNETLSD